MDGWSGGNGNNTTLFRFIIIYSRHRNEWSEKKNIFWYWTLDIAMPPLGESAGNLIIFEQINMCVVGDCGHFDMHPHSNESFEAPLNIDDTNECQFSGGDAKLNLFLITTGSHLENVCPTSQAHNEWIKNQTRIIIRLTIWKMSNGEDHHRPQQHPIAVECAVNFRCAHFCYNFVFSLFYFRYDPYYSLENVHFVHESYRFQKSRSLICVQLATSINTNIHFVLILPSKYHCVTLLLLLVKLSFVSAKRHKWKIN